MRFFAGPTLLVIDPPRLPPLCPAKSLALFQVVSQRYLKTSIVYDHQPRVASWGEVLGDTTVAAAMLDRLLHRSVVLNLDGDSYRLREPPRQRQSSVTQRQAPPTATVTPAQGKFDKRRPGGISPSAINAIDDQLEDATAVLDAFHVVKLGTQAVDEVRRRVQQEIHGHRGRKERPALRHRWMILRCGQEKLTDRASAPASTRRSPPTNVTTRCSSPGCVPNSSGRPTRPRARSKAGGSPRRSSGQPADLPDPGDQATRATLKQWRKRSWPTSTPAAPTTAAPEAINGLIELHRRIARGFRNREHYRLRMLLIGGGLTHPHLR